MDTPSSPWMPADAASEYLTGGARTETGRRKFSERFLAQEVKAGRLRAARVGGRGQLLYRRDWLNQYLEDLARPIEVMRRRA